MPPLEQTFSDLEIGNKGPEAIASGAFSFFSPQPKEPSKLTIRVGSADWFGLSSIDLSEPDSPLVSKTRITKQEKIKKTKTVSFSSSVRVRFIPSQKEIPEEQKQRVWYSSEEAKDIRRRAIAVVEKMSANKPVGKNETTRGLETKTPQEHRIRRRRIRKTILAVLKAQNSNPSHQVLSYLMEQDSTFNSLDTWDNYEYVASIYRYASRESVSESINFAAMDAKEARSYCHESI